MRKLCENSSNHNNDNKERTPLVSGVFTTKFINFQRNYIRAVFFPFMVLRRKSMHRIAFTGWHSFVHITCERFTRGIGMVQCTAFGDGAQHTASPTRCKSCTIEYNWRIEAHRMAESARWQRTGKSNVCCANIVLFHSIEPTALCNVYGVCIRSLFCFACSRPLRSHIICFLFICSCFAFSFVIYGLLCWQ